MNTLKFFRANSIRIGKGLMRCAVLGAPALAGVAFNRHRMLAKAAGRG
jgi:hypothetical protein